MYEIEECEIFENGVHTHMYGINMYFSPPKKGRSMLRVTRDVPEVKDILSQIDVHIFNHIVPQTQNMQYLRLKNV